MPTDVGKYWDQLRFRVNQLKGDRPNLHGFFSDGLPLILKTLAAPPDPVGSPTVTTVTASSISANWTTPVANGEQVTGYRVWACDAQSGACVAEEVSGSPPPTTGARGRHSTNPAGPSGALAVPSTNPRLAAEEAARPRFRILYNEICGGFSSLIDYYVRATRSAAACNATRPTTCWLSERRDGCGERVID